MTDAVIQKILRSFPIFANSVTCEKKTQDISKAKNFDE